MGLFGLGKQDEPVPNPTPGSGGQQPQRPAQPNPISGGPEFSEAIENALREGGRQIRFDDIEKRYRGKRVWVLDRAKIQENVMKVVDAAFARSLEHAEGGVATRARVAQALARLFGDNRNLTSEVDPAKLAARQVNAQKPGQAAAAAPAAVGGATGVDLQRQIERLEDVIGRAEQMISKLSTTMMRSSWSSSPQRSGIRHRPGPFDEVHSRALEEIFRSNLELRKSLSSPPAGAS